MRGGRDRIQGLWTRKCGWSHSLSPELAAAWLWEGPHAFLLPEVMCPV